MKLKKLILFQLALFFGLAITVACERNEECGLSAANNSEKKSEKIKLSSYSVTSSDTSINTVIK